MTGAKSVLVGVAGALGILAAASQAAALTTFEFSYSGADFSGSGEFTSNDSKPDYYITGASGTANGSAITGVSFYAGASNLLDYPGGPLTDQGGISFTTADGNAYNLFTQPGQSGYFVISQKEDPWAWAACATPVSFSVAVPEPATWAIMLTGFGLAGAGLRARRRSTTALA